MATYLLTWNPLHWKWTDLSDEIDKFNKQGYLESGWSCGVTKKIVPGDRVFLMKLGKEPKGIMASGWTTSGVKEYDHWSEENKTALYIDVRFDRIIDPDKIIFPLSELRKVIYNWMPQASGRTIPDDIAGKLEIDWANFLRPFIQLCELTLPEEIDTTKTFKEGSAKQIMVNSYERSAEARSRCVRHYGTDCSVCGFNFEKTYGHTGGDYIHVHHLKPLSEIEDDYLLNPIEDLRPVCPNCHSMLHRKKPPYTIEELKQKIIKT
jgi:5-methylcytosine-specific restriction protein A